VTTVATATAPSGEPATGERAERVARWLPFVARRLVRFLVSVWVLVTFAFLIIHLVPGDPVRAALGARASVQVVQAERLRLGLDDPLLVQYGHFLSGLVHGDLGVSIQSRTPVVDVISQRLPNTLALAFLAFLVVVLVAIPVGALVAVRTQGGQHRGTELGFASTSVVLATIPDFVLAVVLGFGLAVSAAVLPIAGRSGPASFVIPVLALAIGPAAALGRLVRVEMLGVLDEDYVRTGRAKRLRPGRLYLRHALPNALTATLTVSGLLLSGLIAGTVLVETVMAWPGLGPTLVSSIINKDYPMVQGVVLVYGGLVLVVNLVVDLLLARLDPRVTVQEA
jgi:peptide/nickel transport system permease protein